MKGKIKANGLETKRSFSLCDIFYLNGVWGWKTPSIRVSMDTPLRLKTSTIKYSIALMDRTSVTEAARLKRVLLRCLYHTNGPLGQHRLSHILRAGTARCACGAPSSTARQGGVMNQEAPSVRAG
jgi:hypothetical protein